MQQDSTDQVSETAPPATNPLWTVVVPLLALGLLVAELLSRAGWLKVAALVALPGTVFAGVHHAEVISRRIGEPFGTLVLAVVVTVTEVALIASLMLAPDARNSELARDAVLSAIMLTSNGLVGLCLLLGGLFHREQEFQVRGASAALAVLCALATMTLILPNHLTTTPGPTLSCSQLTFVGVVSMALYLTFVFVQTIRHRELFLSEPVETGERAPAPGFGAVLASAGLLLGALVGVVGLAEVLAPVVESAVVRAGAPVAVVGIIISMIVLLPESAAALRAARSNQLQNSLNLAHGSALASIGLTIPAIGAVSIAFDVPVVLGVSPKDTVLLALTLLVSVITLSTGRTTVLQGMVHLIVLAAYLFMAVVP